VSSLTLGVGETTFPNGPFACCILHVGDTIEYIPTKTIKENGRTVVVPLNETAKANLRKYSKLPNGRLSPFIPSQQYNEHIRQVLRIVGIDRMVTIIDPLTGKEAKKPICDIAASCGAEEC